MEAQQGFTVTRHAYDLETAWSAVFTSSATDPEDQDVPTIGFNSEMDALKSGHACGHNLIAISGCASAVATARTLEDFGLPGRVVLLGTPAEEGGGGKAIMLERGAYKGMDACLMLHPGGGSRSGQHGAGIITSNCISGVVATFKGRSSHAGATPEHAINALDAAFVAYSAISVLRQQLPPGIKVHGIINGSDQWSPNGPFSLARLPAQGCQSDSPGCSDSEQRRDDLRNASRVRLCPRRAHPPRAPLLRRRRDRNRLLVHPRAEAPLPRPEAVRPAGRGFRASCETLLARRGGRRRDLRGRDAREDWR